MLYTYQMLHQHLIMFCNAWSYQDTGMSAWLRAQIRLAVSRKVDHIVLT